MAFSRACAVAVISLWAAAADAQPSKLLGALETELVFAPMSRRDGEATVDENVVRYRGWAPSYFRAAARWYPGDLFIGAYADARFETFAISGIGFIPGDEFERRVFGGQLGAGVTLRHTFGPTWSAETNAGFSFQSLPFGVYDPASSDSAVSSQALGFIGPTLGGAARWTQGLFGAELRLGFAPFSLSGGLGNRSASGGAFSLGLQGHAGRLGVPGADLQPVAGYELTATRGAAETLEASQVSHRFFLGVRALLGTLRQDRTPTGPGWIRGRVLTAEGTPLQGAVVMLRDTGETVTVKADGVYQFREVDPGRRVLEVTAEGFRDVRAEVTVAPEAELVSDLTVQAKSGPGTVRGKVSVRNTDGTAGAALPGAQIQGPEGVAVTAGADGGFVFEKLGPGLVTLFIRAPGHTATEEVVSVPPEGEATLEVTLSPEKQRTLASLRGRVRSVRGAPIAAELRIPEAQVATRAGKDGRFVVRLPGGTYTVVFSAPGFITQTKTVVVADGDQALFYVDLSPEER